MNPGYGRYTLKSDVLYKELDAILGLDREQYESNQTVDQCAGCDDGGDLLDRRGGDAGACPRT